MIDSTTDVTTLLASFDACAEERNALRAQRDRLGRRLLIKRAELAMERILLGYDMAQAASSFFDESDPIAERRVVTWTRRYEKVKRIMKAAAPELEIG
jgi:hypothetical protein